MQKIKNIEFLRLFLIFGVVTIHVFCSSAWSFYKIFPGIDFFETLNKCFAHGNLCVEGFFIIAGFLLVMTFKDVPIKEFILKKYIRLSPTIIFATVICAISALFGIMHFKLWANLMTILLLNHFGICFAIGSNPALWYTSALFAGLLLYFVLIKNFKGEKLYKICASISIISYALLEIFQHGNFGDPYHNYLWIFNVGFMRSLGGIGLGVLIGSFFKANSDLQLNKFFINILEILSFSGVIWWIIIPHRRINSILFVILFCILLFCFIYNSGILSKFLDKEIWAKLGKYQYSIYVIHYVVGKIMVNGLWRYNKDFVYNHPYFVVLVTIGAIIAAGILTYYMVEFPCTKFLKKKFNI